MAAKKISLLLFLLIHLISSAQSSSHSKSNGNLQIDSLSGFSEAAIRDQYSPGNFSPPELNYLVRQEKRKFINEKFRSATAVVPATPKNGGINFTNVFPC